MASLRDRTLTDLKAVCGDLVESLCGTFPESTEMNELCKALTNGLDSEGDEFIEFLNRLTQLLHTTIPQRMVKYDRAIYSITGNPLSVYQVLMYKDIATVTGVFSRLQSLEMDKKIKSLSSGDLAMFWQFVHEATQLVLRATNTIPPVVPTPEQIAEDIEKRKRQRDKINNNNGAFKANMSVVDGVDDLWKELCQTRNVKSLPFNESITERISRFLTSETTEEHMVCNFPELGDETYSDESLAIARRIGSLCTMKNAIPTNMMSGIERVASSLVRDINSGKMDFASLDVEKIGEQVLQGVGEGDVSDFANSLDKILPALQSMGSMGKM
tara:strand:- start:1579 stop:2562 length:984 start_codon:yes stop_codon:yes gene_type:complete